MPTLLFLFDQVLLVPLQEVMKWLEIGDVAGQAYGSDLDPDARGEGVVFA
jgi:hypothetical protein